MAHALSLAALDTLAVADALGTSTADHGASCRHQKDEALDTAAAALTAALRLLRGHFDRSARGQQEAELLDMQRRVESLRHMVSSLGVLRGAALPSDYSFLCARQCTTLAGRFSVLCHLDCSVVSALPAAIPALLLQPLLLPAVDPAASG